MIIKIIFFPFTMVYKINRNLLMFAKNIFKYNFKGFVYLSNLLYKVLTPKKKNNKKSDQEKQTKALKIKNKQDKIEIKNNEKPTKRNETKINKLELKRKKAIEKERQKFERKKDRLKKKYEKIEARRKRKLEKNKKREEKQLAQAQKTKEKEELKKLISAERDKRKQEKKAQIQKKEEEKRAKEELKNKIKQEKVAKQKEIEKQKQLEIENKKKQQLEKEQEEKAQKKKLQEENKKQKQEEEKQRQEEEKARLAKEKKLLEIEKEKESQKQEEEKKLLQKQKEAEKLEKRRIKQSKPKFEFAKYMFNSTLILSLIVYKFFKYILYSLVFPIKLIIKLIPEKLTKEEKEAIRLEKINKKKAEYREKLEAKAEKRRKKEAEEEKKMFERASKKKNQGLVYVNEDIDINKKTVGEKIKDFFTFIIEIPKTIKAKFLKQLNNSTFVKNYHNKKDINKEVLKMDFEGDDAVKSDVKIVYEYVAKSPEGKVVKGYFEAYSKVEVHSFLLSESFEVYSIRTSSWITFLHGSSSVSRTKFKTKDLIFLLTQLSTYIKAGIPLVEAVKILSRQFKKKSYKKMFNSMIYDLTMGNNFSQALDNQQGAFPKILINMVKAAEMTGELPEALDNLEEYFTETDKTRKQMITAMIYPAIVLVLSFVVVGFIIIVIVPTFVDMYASMDSNDIPYITKVVMATSDFLREYTLVIFGSIIMSIVLFIYLYKNIKVVRTVMQYLFMKMPVLGNIIIYNEVTIFTKTFSSLLAHNVFITESMEILNKLTNNEIYKMMILDTIVNLGRGNPISDAYKDSWAFPMPAYEMIVTGEKTGQLPDMMLKVSKFYQEQHRQAVTRLKTLIEPLLIVFLTFVVGGIIIAIIIPMFGMLETIQ